MKRPPAWARPKRADGELAAQLMPATPRRLGELCDLASDPRVPPNVRAVVGNWLASKERSALEVRQAIDRLKELITESEGEQRDLFQEGGSG